MNETIANNLSRLLNPRMSVDDILCYMEARVWEFDPEPNDNGFIQHGFYVRFRYNSLTGKIRESM